MHWMNSNYQNSVTLCFSVIVIARVYCPQLSLLSCHYPVIVIACWSPKSTDLNSGVSIGQDTNMYNMHIFSTYVAWQSAILTCHLQGQGKNNGFFEILDLNIEEEKYQIGKHKSAKQQPNWQEEDKGNFKLHVEFWNHEKYKMRQATEGNVVFFAIVFFISAGKIKVDLIQSLAKS